MKLTTNVFDRLRQPEYTGRNRCPTCTWVNSIIAIVVSVVVGAVTVSVASTTIGLAVGGTVLGLSAGAIYLRGYLVPGTPELTKKYFPLWLKRLFGKDAPPETPEVDLQVDPVEGLQTSGALEECPDVDDLCLSEAFRTRWHDRYDEMAAREDLTPAVAAYLGRDEDEIQQMLYAQREPNLADLDIDPENPPVSIAPDGEGGWKALTAEEVPIDVEEDELPDIDPDELAAEMENLDEEDEPQMAFTVYTEDGPPSEWPSREALVAELAAWEVLEEEWDWEQWAELDQPTQVTLLNGLRLFLDRCPSCGTDLTQSEETVESCCADGEVFAVSCEACESRMFESALPDEAAP